MSSREPRRGPRTRGRTALGRLPSTDAFDTDRKKSPLTPDERKLVLLLLVALADDRGSLATARRRLVEAFGSQDGHWCAGKTEDALLHLLAKSIGQGASSPPPWERIVDLVGVAVPRPRRDIVLSQAAALYARSIGWDEPVPDYDGPLSVPEWIEEPVVTVGMIVAGWATGSGPTVPGPRVPPGLEGSARHSSLGTGGSAGYLAPGLADSVGHCAPGAEGSAEHQAPRDGVAGAARSAVHPLDDPVALRRVMLAVAGACSRLDEQVKALSVVLTSQRIANWKLRSENHRQRTLLEQLLREKYAGASTDTIRQLIAEQLRSIITSDPPEPRPLHG